MTRLMGSSHDRRLEDRVKKRENEPKKEPSPGECFPGDWRITYDERKLLCNHAGLDNSLCGYLKLPCWANGGEYKNKTQIYGKCAHINKVCHSPFPMNPLEDCVVNQAYLIGRVETLNYFNVDGEVPLKWEFYWRDEKVVANIDFDKNKKGVITPYIEVIGSYRPRSKKIIKKGASERRKLRKRISPIGRPEKLKSSFLKTVKGRETLELYLYGELSPENYKNLKIDLRRKGRVIVRRRL
jgi:hypothetical protein